MQDFRTIELETVSMEGQESCPTYAVHVGLDVHKDSIAVALAPGGSDRPARNAAAAATLGERSTAATASSSSASVPGSRAARQSGSRLNVV